MKNFFKSLLMCSVMVVVCMQKGMSLQPDSGENLVQAYYTIVQATLEQPEPLKDTDPDSYEKEIMKTLTQLVETQTDTKISTTSGSGAETNIQHFFILWDAVQSFSFQPKEREALLLQIAARIEDEIKRVIQNGSNMGYSALSNLDRRLIARTSLLIQQAFEKNQIINEAKRDELIKDSTAFKKDFLTLAQAIDNKSKQASSSMDTYVQTQQIIEESQLASTELFQGASTLQLYTLQMRLNQLKKHIFANSSLEEGEDVDPELQKNPKQQVFTDDDVASKKALEKSAPHWIDQEEIALLDKNYIPFFRKEQAEYEKRLKLYGSTNNLVVTKYAQDEAQKILGTSLEGLNSAKIEQLSKTFAQTPSQKTLMEQYDAQGKTTSIDNNDVRINVYWVEDLPTDLMHHIGEGQIDIFVYKKLQPLFVDSQTNKLTTEASFLIDKEIGEASFRITHQRHDVPALIDNKQTGDLIASQSRVEYETEFLVDYLGSKVTDDLQQSLSFLKQLKATSDFYLEMAKDKTDAILSHESAGAMGEFYEQLYTQLSEKVIGPLQTHLDENLVYQFDTSKHLESIPFADLVKQSVQVSVSS